MGGSIEYHLRVDLTDHEQTPPLEKVWTMRLHAERPKEWATAFRAVGDMIGRDAR